MIDRNSPTSELEAVARRFWVPNPYPDDEAFIAQFVRYCELRCQDLWQLPLPCTAILEPIGEIALAFWRMERRHYIRLNRERPADPIEHARYRDNLLNLIKLSQESPKEWTQKYIENFFEIILGFLRIIPDDAWYAVEESPNRARIFDLFGETVTESVNQVVCFAVARPDLPSTAFGQLSDTILDNLPRTDGREVIWPEQYSGPLDKLVDTYLKKTPLRDLYFMQVPLRVADDPEETDEEETEEEITEPDIDERAWYQHCLLLAGTGGGKTNAIRWRMVQVLFQVEQGEASLVLMEPKGVLTRELIRFVQASGLEARLTVIEPGDPRIAVNLFENDDRSPQGINAAVARISRIFSTITLDLTAFQRTALTFALRAMFAVPGPVNLRTLMGILRTGIKDLPVQNLSFAVQDFFDNEFKPGMAGARAGAEIISRLNGLLADPVFESLFAADRTTFDIGREMQTGKVVVVNSSAAAPLYSRFWIEEVSRTIQHRLRLPFSHRMPSTFIIDEAQNFIAEDMHFAEILDMAREARIGMLVAAHHMGQITNDHVRNSLYTNTALKFVARTSADIFNLCRSMGETEPSFLNTLPQYHFGFFGPNMRSATEVKLPLTEFTRSTPHQDPVAPAPRPSRPRGPNEPIVGFNERPPEMENWRLDHDYKPPSENASRPGPTPEQEGGPIPEKPPRRPDPKPQKPAVDPNPPSEGSTDWHS